MAANLADTALIIVDIQNDFCPSGSLPIPAGDTVIPAINDYAAHFAAAGRPVFASRDWHPPRTRHFAAYGGAWPVHCVQGTAGAAFHPELRLPEGAVIVSKGADPEEDAYSVFQAWLPDGRGFAQALAAAGIRHLYIGGLATDYCVKLTVLDALDAAFTATVLLDASLGVNVQTHDAEEALRAMAGAGAEMTTLKRLAR